MASAVRSVQQATVSPAVHSVAQGAPVSTVLRASMDISWNQHKSALSAQR
jgi:hypothetical protein